MSIVSPELCAEVSDPKTQFDCGIKMIISAHETQITFFNNEIFRLNSEIESHLSKITKIEEMYTALLQEKNNIETKYSKLRSHNKHLQKQIDVLTKENADLKEETNRNIKKHPILFSNREFANSKLLEHQKISSSIRQSHLNNKDHLQMNYSQNEKGKHSHSYSLNNTNTKNDTNSNRSISSRNMFMEYYTGSIGNACKNTTRLMKHGYSGNSTIHEVKNNKKSHSLCKTHITSPINNNNKTEDKIIKRNRSYTGNVLLSGCGRGLEGEGSKFFQKCRERLSHSEYTDLHNIIHLFNVNELSKEDMLINVNNLLMNGNYEELIEEFKKMFT